MLHSEGINNILPGITDLEEAIEIYHGFPKFRERESNFSVIAIRIKFLYSTEN